MPNPVQEPSTAFASGGPYNLAEGSTLASAATIAPNGYVSHVTGTTTISTVTPPFAGCDQLVLIPDGLWSTNTAGNIALATTGVVSKALVLTWSSSTGKWYPSY